MRVTRAVRTVAAVAVAGVVRLALDDNAVAVVVAVNKQGQEAGNEEKDAVPGL